jgi:hypothetical protein
MVSIRLIAQYPNVGNSGHIFLVPTGQKQNSLGIGEKINTQMLSIRHEASVFSDNNVGKSFDSSLLRGKDFLAVSIPIKQVLKEKSSDRVSYIWIAIEGFDLAFNERLIFNLQIELQSLIPKVESVVLNLGHLDPNASRYIEVKEMVEWAQNPVFLSINKSAEPANSSYSPNEFGNKKPISNKYNFFYVGFAMIFLVCFILLLVQKKPPIDKPQPPNVENYMTIINNVCKNTTDDMVESAAHFFGISKVDLIARVEQHNWEPPMEKGNIIKSSILIKFLDKIKDEDIKKIKPFVDSSIEDVVRNGQISKEQASAAKRFVDETNKFLDKLLCLKSGCNNKFVRYLINQRGWSVSDQFVFEFVRNNGFKTLVDNDQKAAEDLYNLNEVLIHSVGLASTKSRGRLKDSFEDAIKFGSYICFESMNWYEFKDIDKKIAGYIDVLKNR